MRSTVMHNCSTRIIKKSHIFKTALTIANTEAQSRTGTTEKKKKKHYYLEPLVILIQIDKQDLADC